ncbi:protein kinase domain-containing protein, partial [[Ruminococcus] torques]
LCEVLDYLHTRKPRILHSDIKPANIMVTPEGDICLIDFNISLDGSVTQEVQGLSRRYASPEQFRCAMDKMYGRKSSETLDERMDIYSLGAVFYRMMSGYLPDAQNGVPYALSQIDIPYADGLKRIVDKAMDRDVSRRFRTAKQMEEALSHMEKYDPKYRRLTNLQILTATAWGFCILAGIFLIASGVRQRGKELWQQEYQEFYAVVGSGDSENIIREGTELLNNSSLQGYMKRNKEQKAEVLHAVGDGYFYSEQYDTAGKYYEEALSCDSGNSLYVRDYMTAMARNGSPVDIWTIQSEYPEAAIDEAATVFVQAQSMYAKGDQKSAVSLCEEALGKSMDAELNAQIYLLEAELYLEQGDINSAADAAAQAVKLDESSNVLRKAAVTAYQAGNEERIGTVKNQWYRQALAYYEMLCQKNDPSYEDRLGRALLLRVLGKYRDSTDVLEEMKIDYPKDYKVQMWICYNYLDEASEEGTYSNVSGDLKFTYHSCRNLYENRADRSEEDPDMEMLEETMKELE